MTELRDARLRKALDTAPDAQLQPHARTREAIRAAAHGAVQPAWKRWWPRGGGTTPGWAAALATFVVASLVVVLWEGREVPGARTETDVVARAPAPAAAPPPAPVPAPLPRAAAPAPAPPPAATAPQAPAPAARPTPRPLPAPPPEKREAAAPPPVLADEAPAAAKALARGADAARRQQRIENHAAEAPVVAAAPPPPAASPAPAAGAGSPAATAQRQVAPAAPSAALRAAPTALPWSQVRIESGGRAVVVPRAQAGRLPALVTSLLASPPADAQPGATGSLRLELGQGDEAAGVLEQVGGRWRWTPLREGHQARWLRPEPEVAAALEEEIGRLLER